MSCFCSILKKSLFLLLLCFFLLFLYISSSNMSCYVVLSGSMEPAVPTGSLILVVPDSAPPEGAIITCQIGNTTVTHRIEHILENGYILKGDASEKPDAQPVSKEQVVGRVVLTIPLLGKILLILRKKEIWVLLLCALISGGLTMKKRMLTLLISVAVLGLFTAGATLAYFTDYESLDNHFVVGKVTIDLEEPNWNPEENQKLVPGDEIPKDPQITNTGKNDAFVYLEVSVPIRDVITVNPDGTRNPSAETELFAFQPSADWKLLSSERVDMYQIYTFCYTKILHPGFTTTPLFHTVTFANLVEGQLEEEELLLPVRAYGIQADNTGGDQTDTPSQAKEAFQKYMNQNKGQAGEVTK